MLSVKTPEEVLSMCAEQFPEALPGEKIPVCSAWGRVLAEELVCGEYIPGFDRSTVDGYAIRAVDSFGCSEAIPAILPLGAAVEMGKSAPEPLEKGRCVPIPTGGALPKGADAVVMIEYTEDYGDGSVGIFKPAAPGENVIYKGDDARPGKRILSAGRRLTAPDIGALAAMGMPSVSVVRKPLVGILSTGDELVPPEEAPAAGQVRDVNSATLAALCQSAGAECETYGIVPDDESALGQALDEALSRCDTVIISGGSSVGQKDAVSRVIASRGELLFHGIAMKPGKPTMLGKVGGKGVWGLPGHPVAAFFTAQLFVCPLIARLGGRSMETKTVRARLTEPLSANHGRAQYTGVFLREEGGQLFALPIRSKSGLIVTLADSDGFLCVPRDCEGYPAGAEVDVTLYSFR